MTPEFEGIHAKLDRSLVHLQTLDGEIRKYIKGKTHTIGGEYQPQTRCYVYKVTSIKTPRPGMGIVLGDYVHNLRSALDHLAWQLVKKMGTIQPDDWTAFPMSDTPRKFRERVVAPGRRGKRNPLLGLEGTPAWAAIEALQPYHRGDVPEALGLLHAVSVEDKHRVVPPTLTAVRHPGPEHRLGFGLNADAGELLDATVHVARPLEHGTEIVTLQLAPTGPNPDVEMRGRLALDIGFGRAQILSSSIPQLHTITTGVVNDFEQRFF